MTDTTDRVRQHVTALSEMSGRLDGLRYIDAQKLRKADLLDIASVLNLTDARPSDRRATLAELIVATVVGQADAPRIRQITGRMLHYAIEVTRDGGHTWLPVDVPWRYEEDTAIRPAKHPVYAASAGESHGETDPAQCAANIAAFYKLADLAESSEWPLWRVRVWIGEPAGRDADGQWSNTTIKTHVGATVSIRLTANHAVVIDPCDGSGSEIFRFNTADEALADWTGQVERQAALDAAPPCQEYRDRELWRGRTVILAWERDEIRQGLHEGVATAPRYVVADISHPHRSVRLTDPGTGQTARGGVHEQISMLIEVDDDGREIAGEYAGSDGKDVKTRDLPKYVGWTIEVEHGKRLPITAVRLFHSPGLSCSATLSLDDPDYGPTLARRLGVSGIGTTVYPARSIPVNPLPRRPMLAGQAVTVDGGVPVPDDVRCYLSAPIQRIDVGRVVRTWIHPTTGLRWYDVSMAVTGDLVSRPATQVTGAEDYGWAYPHHSGDDHPVIFEAQTLHDDGQWVHEAADIVAALNYRPAELDNLAEILSLTYAAQTQRQSRVSVIPAKEPYRRRHPDAVGYATADPASPTRDR